MYAVVVEYKSAVEKLASVSIAIVTAARDRATECREWVRMIWRIIVAENGATNKMLGIKKESVKESLISSCVLTERHLVAWSRKIVPSVAQIRNHWPKLVFSTAKTDVRTKP